MSREVPGSFRNVNNSFVLTVGTQHNCTDIPTYHPPSSDWTEEGTPPALATKAGTNSFVTQSYLPLTG